MIDLLNKFASSVLGLVITGCAVYVSFTDQPLSEDTFQMLVLFGVSFILARDK